jgi:hypothetical protein
MIAFIVLSPFIIKNIMMNECAVDYSELTYYAEETTAAATNFTGESDFDPACLIDKMGGLQIYIILCLLCILMYAAKDTGFKLNIVLLCIVASVVFGFMIKPTAGENVGSIPSGVRAGPISGQPCHAGNPCVTTDECHVAGACGETGTCDAETPVADSPATDCTATVGAVSTPGTCNAGSCVASDQCVGIICPTAAECMVPGTCTDGTCSASTAAAAGSPCDDVQANTHTDQCDGAGTCVGLPTCVSYQTACTNALSEDPPSPTCTGADSSDQSDCAVHTDFTTGDGSAGTCKTANACSYAAAGSIAAAARSPSWSDATQCPQDPCTDTDCCI